MAVVTKTVTGKSPRSISNGRGSISSLLFAGRQFLDQKYSARGAVFLMANICCVCVRSATKLAELCCVWQLLLRVLDIDNHVDN